MTILKKLNQLRVGFTMGRRGFLKGRPNLVMIHGAGGTSVTWKNQTLFLDKALNALALDLPGHGETEGRGYDSISSYARWLVTTLEHLFDEPLFLMGHSMGGAVILEGTLLSPDLVKAMVLVSTGSRLKVPRSLLNGLPERLEDTIDRITGVLYGPKGDRAMVREGARLLKEAGPRIIYKDLKACNRYDIMEGIKRIHRPCLILCGGEDKVTPPGLSEELQKAIKGSLLKIFHRSGHMVMIESYREVNRAVLNFVNQVTSTDFVQNENML